MCVCVCVCVCVWGRGGGGYYDIFWGVQKLEFQYFLWGSEKLIFCGGMKISWIFLGGTDTTVFGVITKMDWSTVHSSKNPDH